jgi:hypothetical protein
MTDRRASALLTMDGVPFRVLFAPATPEHVRRTLLDAQAEQEAHRARARASCESLSGSRDPLLMRPRRRS